MVGPRQGRKQFTLQTLSGIEETFSGSTGQAAGLSLHAGLAAAMLQRDRLERLYCFYTRQAIFEKRVSLTIPGKIRYELPVQRANHTIIGNDIQLLLRLSTTRYSDRCTVIDYMRD